VADKPRLKAADPSARATCKSAPTGTTRSYICQNATLDRLVDRLNDDSGGYLQHKVVDVTGLTGIYDFTLTWTLPFTLPGPDSGQAGYTLFEAIDRQLGLKLRLQKHPMPVLIVDHIDRQPTEN
ncbi:MAG TPA: TIGR03435 family protein, partial [Terriglobales bacterium]